MCRCQCQWPRLKGRASGIKPTTRIGNQAIKQRRSGFLWESLLQFRVTKPASSDRRLKKERKWLRHVLDQTPKPLNVDKMKEAIQQDDRADSDSLIISLSTLFDQKSFQWPSRIKLRCTLCGEDYDPNYNFSESCKVGHTLLREQVNLGTLSIGSTMNVGRNGSGNGWPPWEW